MVANRIKSGWYRRTAPVAALLAAFASPAHSGNGSTIAVAAQQQARVWPGGAWTPGEAVYGTGVDSQVSVTMSDGTILKADISYPTDRATGTRATGPFPVVLTVTPYGARPSQGDLFVQRGYIFVIAYVRGTQNSSGDFGFFNDRDAKDGAELVRWAATRLQNSNGTIGLWGGSYGGLNQIYTVAALGPRSPVKAMAAYCMGAEFYRETYFSGGIPTQTTNFQRGLGRSTGASATPNPGGYSGAAYIAEVTAGGPRAYDVAFWKSRTPGEYVQKVVDAGVPLLIWSSNGDLYAQSSLELYTYLQNAASKAPVYGPMKQNQKASGRYQILISQGGHCANQDQQITLEWYDTWLKGLNTGMQDTSTPVHVHELVSNKWLNTSAYPVVSAYTRYYLTANGGLSPGLPTAATEDRIVWAQPGAESMLQYESSAFESGATLAGPISASFYASSTTRNLELIATLQLVNADGSVTPLTTGTILGSLAANDPARSWVDEKGVPVRPYGKYLADEYVPAGRIQRYDFVLSPRFAAIPPGSKLRMVVTTQTPTSKCGGGLGIDPCFPTDPQKASLEGSTTTLYSGPVNRSSVNLPLLPASCWQASDNPGVPYWKGTATITASAPCQAR
jgi:predicted acyl esterase